MTMDRPPELHPSALSNPEHTHYTRALAAIAAVRAGEWESVRNVSAMSVRRYVAGRYGVEDEVVEQILAIWNPTPTLDDTLTPYQLFAVLRLVAHAQRGREVDKKLIFSQTPPPIEAKSTRPPPKHGSSSIGPSTAITSSPAGKPPSPPSSSPLPSTSTPTTMRTVQSSPAVPAATGLARKPPVPLSKPSQPTSEPVIAGSSAPPPPARSTSPSKPRPQSPEKPILPPPRRTPSTRKSMGDVPRPAFPTSSTPGASTGPGQEVPPLPRRSFDSPNPFRRASSTSHGSSAAAAASSLVAVAPAAPVAAAPAAGEAHNPFRTSNSAPALQTSPPPPLPRRPSISTVPSISALSASPGPPPAPGPATPTINPKPGNTSTPAKPPLPPRQPSMSSSPAVGGVGGGGRHARAASVAGTERTVTPSTSAGRKLPSGGALAPGIPALSPSPAAFPSSAAATSSSLAAVGTANKPPAPPPKPPKPTTLTSPTTTSTTIPSSLAAPSPLILESLAAARQRREREANDPARKRVVEVVRSSNPLSMFAQRQGGTAGLAGLAGVGGSGAGTGSVSPGSGGHARRQAGRAGRGGGNVDGTGTGNGSGGSGGNVGRRRLTGEEEGMEIAQVETTTDDGSRASDADPDHTLNLKSTPSAGREYVRVRARTHTSGRARPAVAGAEDGGEESMDEDEIRAVLAKSRSQSFGTLKDLPSSTVAQGARRDVLPPPPRRRPESVQQLPSLPSGGKARRSGNSGGLSRHSSLSLPPPPPYQPPALPSLSHFLRETKQSLDLGVEKLSLAAQGAHTHSHTHGRHQSLGGEKLAGVGNAVQLELERLKRGSVSRGYVDREGEGWGRRGVGEEPLIDDDDADEAEEESPMETGRRQERGMTPYEGDGEEGEVFGDHHGRRPEEGWVRLG